MVMQTKKLNNGRCRKVVCLDVPIPSRSLSEGQKSFKKMGGVWSELSETIRNNQKLDDAQWKG